MCAGIVEQAEISGSAKGAGGWFPVSRARAVYDHPFHAQADNALIIDFVNPQMGPGARVSIELSPDSATTLVGLIESALLAGEAQHARAS